MHPRFFLTICLFQSKSRSMHPRFFLTIPLFQSKSRSMHPRFFLTIRVFQSRSRSMHPCFFLTTVYVYSRVDFLLDIFIRNLQCESSVPLKWQKKFKLFNVARKSKNRVKFTRKRLRLQKNFQQVFSFQPKTSKHMFENIAVLLKTKTEENSYVCRIFCLSRPNCPAKKSSATASNQMKKTI